MGEFEKLIDEKALEIGHHIEDDVLIYGVKQILDEAKKDFPGAPVSFDDILSFEKRVMKWFKKWFGED